MNIKRIAETVRERIDREAVAAQAEETAAKLDYVAMMTGVELEEEEEEDGGNEEVEQVR